MAALFPLAARPAPRVGAHTQANEVADAWMLAANDFPDEDAVYFAALPFSTSMPSS